MKYFPRVLAICLLLGCLPAAWGQIAGPKVDRVDIQYIGPASVSEQFIRANINLKAGDIYHENLTEEDIHSLYGTGQFYNIRVDAKPQPDGGVVITYLVQANLRITDIKITGNKKLSDSKIRKKITVKAGQPLDEEKLFTDTQAIKDLYEKYGYSGTQVRYVFDTMDEAAGTASVTFEIAEAPKIRIVNVIFDHATAFPQKVLRKQIKTRRHWMFSWITGSGVFKQDQFDEDRDALLDFYRSHGYLDFEIQDVRMDHPRPNTIILHIAVYEGKQYHVGSIKFTGNLGFSLPEMRAGLQYIHDFQHLRSHLGPNGLPMDVGDVFTPGGLETNLSLIEDFYGSKGYIDVQPGTGLQATRIPNVDTGTIDLSFQIEEGQKNYVEHIDIHGNVKTKDKVIRRELAISPGEVFDMVRVKISKERLEGLEYFDKVDMDPEPTDPPIAGRKNLEVNVEEQDTGKLTLGAGINSDSGLVGFVEVTQGNFDLFHPPYFTGGGEKLRLYVELGTEQQDYELEFVEPWFLNRKLSLDVDIYRNELDFESPNNIFNETRTGTRLSLTRALGSDFLIGSVSYTPELVGIALNGGWNNYQNVVPFPGTIPPNVPQAILDQTGVHFYQRFGASLAYDTRNSNKLPNHGQRSEIDPEIVVGNTTYYKVEGKTAWYFPGLRKGHVIEALGRVGMSGALQGGDGDVPFYDRFYLGGLYSLRGFKYRNVAPRDPNYQNPVFKNMPNEPIGGDSLWYGSLEYSIPIIDKENGPSVRVAMFFDAGAVGAQPTSFSSDFDDDVGLGLRLDIPHLGPLRLDYGIPITHDQYNSAAGKFQFGFGYTHPF